MFQHNWEVNTWKTEQGGYLLDGNCITKWVIIPPERQHDALLWAEVHLDKKGRILVLVQAECRNMVPFSIYSRSSHCKATATALCYQTRSQGNSLVLQPWLTSILMPTTTSERLVNKKASWLTSRVFWKYCFHCLQNYHQRQQNFSLSLEANRKSYILTEFIE